MTEESYKGFRFLRFFTVFFNDITDGNADKTKTAFSKIVPLPKRVAAQGYYTIVFPKKQTL